MDAEIIKTDPKVGNICPICKEGKVVLSVQQDDIGDTHGAKYCDICNEVFLED